MYELEEFLDVSWLRVRAREVALEGDDSLVTAEARALHHYRCELYGTGGARPVTTIMASDHGAPEVADVVDALAAEAAVIEEAGSYERWALQMGFDPDSRRGERVYRGERRQARLLSALLGEAAYRVLLWETERL